MADQIFIVDPVSQELSPRRAISYAELGIDERRDLEQWIISQPELLGEDYLIVTSEFDRFDKSNRRLDLVALDRSGSMTVIELKLDANRSFADLQAIYYAAFLSTATIEDVVRMLAEFERCDTEEAEQRIREFVNSDDLPEFDGQPRIVLAAGSMDNEELTSSVLWLRKFGIDLTCVELTPYRLPGSENVVVVPRVIIPLPEARDFIVGVERKEAAKVQEKRSDVRLAELWNAVREAFSQQETPFVPGRGIKASYLQVMPRRGSPERKLFDWGKVHYEWAVRKRDSRFDVALHFEYPEWARNEQLLKLIADRRDEVSAGIAYEFEAEPWGKKWAQVQFRIPYEFGGPVGEVSRQGAELMHELINRTWPILTDEAALLASVGPHAD